MTTALIEAPEVEQAALTVPEQARQFIVTCAEDYKAADEVLTAWKSIEGQIHDAYDSIVDAAHKAHKEAVAKRNEFLAPIEEGRKILKPKMAEWRRLEDERIAAERRRLEEISRRQAEERALAEAMAAEAAGDKQAAEEILSAPVAVEAVIVAKETPKTATRFQTRYSAEVVSLIALVKAVAAGTVPINAISANMVFLNQQATSLKDNFNYPGCKCVKRTV